MAEIVMCADKNLISTIWNKMNIVKIRDFHFNNKRHV